MENSKEVRVSKRVLLTPQEIAASVQTLAMTLETRRKVNLAEFEEKTGKIRPAQLAFLTPDVPETLILNQIP